jgi:hypothetical protein
MLAMEAQRHHTVLCYAVAATELSGAACRDNKNRRGRQGYFRVRWGDQGYHMRSLGAPSNPWWRTLSLLAGELVAHLTAGYASVSSPSINCSTPTPSVIRHGGAGRQGVRDKAQERCQWWLGGTG